MNKKLLFAAMSLAALTACTNDDFESKQIAAEESSPIQFEVISDGLTRAQMDDENKIVWNANDGDLFTLYHGSPAAPWTTGYENATYKANANEGGTATLSTPTVIKQGKAIMVWPVDSTFRIGPADALTLKIPAVQTNIENNIPYVSDLIDIEPYAAYSETAAPGVIPTAYKTAGLGRKYKIFMRPMASQLIVKADYAGTDATLAKLYDGGSDGLTGEDAVEEIKVTSVDLLTNAAGTTKFTTEIPLAFNDPAAATLTEWNKAANKNNKWIKVTSFDIPNIVAAGQTDKLTTKCLTGNESAKFLILPQANIADGVGGVDAAAIVVNTIYGKVYVAANGVGDSQYSVTEAADAWYRFLKNKPAIDAEGETTKATKETSGPGKDKFKCTSKPAFGMKQTLNGFSAYTATEGTVMGEPVGAASTRYVKVLLTHLDMTDLHVKSDKQLRDAARVWKKMGLPNVTVYLDGNSSENFVMTQKTIKTINEINNSGANKFTVQPCDVVGEECSTIIITGGDKIQDMTFILKNADTGKKAEVKLNAENWKWDGTVKIATAATTGISRIVNWGTLTNTEDKILAITEPNGTTAVDILFLNDANGTWNITGGKVRVQNRVQNNGKLNISSGAQYLQDGAKLGALMPAVTSSFTNEATGLPTRFGGNNNFGKVENKGVFATISDGEIYNYGLIEHADENAKTYITKNQTDGANFATAFGAANKMGQINLPYSNKDEDNISINAALNSGFVSVTIDGEVTGTLSNTQLGDKVNYVIIKSGVTAVANLVQVKYIEFNSQDNTEIAWNVAAPAAFEGMIVLSDVNIKLGTTVTVNKATYLGKDMYVGGTFTNASWSGYFGNTAGKVATQYITY